MSLIHLNNSKLQENNNNYVDMNIVRKLKIWKSRVAFDKISFNFDFYLFLNSTLLANFYL